MLNKILNEFIPKQAEEIKKAVRDGIPIMIVDNTGSGCEVREKLRCELKANNAILIPDTVSEFREYNTAYLRIELNIEGGEGVRKEYPPWWAYLPSLVMSVAAIIISIVKLLK